MKFAKPKPSQPSLINLQSMGKMRQVLSNPAEDKYRRAARSVVEGTGFRSKSGLRTFYKP